MSRIVFVVIILSLICACKHNKEVIKNIPVGLMNDCLFINEQTGYLVTSTFPDKAIEFFRTANGGKTWTQTDISCHAYPDRMYAFGDTLLLLARHIDSLTDTDTSYLFTSFNRGKHWQMSYKLDYYINDLLPLTALSGQMILRLDSPSILSSHQLVSYNSGAWKPVMYFEADHYFNAILSDRHLFTFVTSEWNSDDVTGVRIINTSTGAEKVFDLDRPYNVQNTHREHYGNSLYIPMLNEISNKNIILRVDTNNITTIELPRDTAIDQDRVLVSHHRLCVGFYDKRRKKHAMLLSKDSGKTWQTDTSFDLPLYVAAASIAGNALYACDYDSIRKLRLDR